MGRRMLVERVGGREGGWEEGREEGSMCNTTHTHTHTYDFATMSTVATRMATPVSLFSRPTMKIPMLKRAQAV